MKFSKEYSKLSADIFTTIRKRTKRYRLYDRVNIISPNQDFLVEVRGRLFLQKKDITEELARSDADCSRQELITQLEKWYGKKFDDFVLLQLRRL